MLILFPRPLPDATTESSEPNSYLLQLIPPREKYISLQAHVEMISALECRDGITLEIAGCGGAGVRFLARAPHATGRDALAAHLRGAYPQGRVVPIVDPAVDPAVPYPDEEADACELRLVEDGYLPLRTAFLEDESYQLESLLGKMRGLPPGLEALCQITVWPAPVAWGAVAERVLLAATRTERAQGIAEEGNGPSPILVLLLALLFSAVIFGGQLWQQSRLHVYIIVSVILATLLASGAILLWMLVLRRHIDLDPHLLRSRVDAKRGMRGFMCRIRVRVRGGTTEERAAALAAICAAYSAYSLPGGNRFDMRPCNAYGFDTIGWAGASRAWRRPYAWLSARELGSLWKPPDAETEVPGLVRAGPRVIFPADPAFDTGLLIGQASDSGHTVNVHMPLAALDQHMVVTGATGSGKSTWVQSMLHAVLQRGTVQDDKRIQLVVIDPHSTLIRNILGWYGRVSDSQPIVIRLADTERPVGFNPLDVTTGRSDGQIIGGLTTGFSRQWDGTWGSRMEMVFRQACLTLLRANRTLPPEEQFTLLDVNPLLLHGGFLQDVLERIEDINLYRYWRDQYIDLSKSLRDQVITPVTSKMSRFEEETAARILGQRCSTISIPDLIRCGADIFIDSDAYAIGADTASILDSLFINSVADAIRERGASDVQTLVVVDEAHHAPAVWETIFTGIRAFGGSVVLITQVTAAFESLQEGLRAYIMGNVGTKACFRAGESVEAEYLAKELGEQVTPADLQDLPAWHGYIKTTDGRRQLPLVSINTIPPPVSATGAADFLARASSLRYGTPAVLVKKERDAWVHQLFLTKNKELAEHPQFLRVKEAADLTAAAGVLVLADGDNHSVDRGEASALPAGSSPGCTDAMTPSSPQQRARSRRQREKRVLGESPRGYSAPLSFAQAGGKGASPVIPPAPITVDGSEA